MDAIKRYWTVDQASRRALRRAFIIPLVIGTVLIIAAAALYMATVDDIETSANLARELGMLQALMAATVIARSTVLLGLQGAQSHQGESSSLTQRRTPHARDLEPAKMALSLALALLGVVSIPGAVVGLVAMAALPIDLEPSNFTPSCSAHHRPGARPYAAKRYTC